MKKLLGIIFALALVMGLSGALSVGALASGGTVSTWAQSDVAEAAEAGIVPDTLPADYTGPITRADFCSIAVRVYETMTGAEIAGRAAFSDTSDANVEKMAYLGVVKGVGDETFHPHDTLTREQAATIIVRLAEAVGKPLAAAEPTFNDKARIGSWAYAAVGQVMQAGIMQGVGGNRFDPQGAYSVEQSIVTLWRTMDVVENGPLTTVIANGSCGAQGDNVTWTLDSTGLLTLSGSGEIARYINGRDRTWPSLREKITRVVVEDGITTLYHSLFSDCVNLVSAVIPDSVTKFSPYLFKGCTSLTTVELPENLTAIQERAFEDCDSLREITIPASVTYLDAILFTSCDRLERITVDPGNELYCSVDGVLFSKDMTELYCYPAQRTQTSYEIPAGVKVISEKAFSGNDHLTSVTIPRSVESIGNNMLADCDKLTDVYAASESHFYFAHQYIRTSETMIEIYSPVTLEPEEEYWGNFTIHSTDRRGVFDHTLTSTEDLTKELVLKLYLQYPTFLNFSVPADRAEDYFSLIEEALEAIWPYNTFILYNTYVPKDGGSAVIRAAIKYRNGMEILPYAMGHLDAIEEGVEPLVQRAEDILEEIILPDMTEYEKVKAIHDWLVHNTAYQKTGDRAHSPMGPILDGLSVCEGYAEAFQLLCSMSGIDCVYVTGDTTEGCHAWNKVKVDGAWYNVDVTWDDPTGSRPILRYDYFLISDSKLAKDHTPDSATWLPASPHDHPADHDGSGNSSSEEGGNTSGTTSETNQGPILVKSDDEYGLSYWVEYGPLGPVYTPACESDLCRYSNYNCYGEDDPDHVEYADERMVIDAYLHGAIQECTVEAWEEYVARRDGNTQN